MCSSDLKPEVIDLDIGGAHGLDLAALADGGRVEPVEFPVLVTHEEPSLGINAHAYPRALFVSWHGVKQLEFEALVSFQISHRGRFGGGRGGWGGEKR